MPCDTSSYRVKPKKWPAFRVFELFTAICKAGCCENYLNFYEQVSKYVILKLYGTFKKWAMNFIVFSHFVHTTTTTIVCDIMEAIDIAAM